MLTRCNNLPIAVSTGCPPPVFVHAFNFSVKFYPAASYPGLQRLLEFNDDLKSATQRFVQVQ